MADNLRPQGPADFPLGASSLPQRLPQRLPQTSLAAVGPHAPLPDSRPADRISLQEILAILSRRKWLIATAVLSLLLIVSIQVLTTTPLYESTATVQIDPDTPKIEPYEQVASFASRDSEEYLFTQARNFQTRTLARRVIERLALADNPTYLEPPKSGFFTDLLGSVGGFARGLFVDSPKAEVSGAGADRFLNQLVVEMEHNTRLLHVTFRSPDPALAAEIANAVVDEFISQSFEVRFEATERATAFLQDRLEELRLKVEESEARVLRYARENDIVNLSEEETVNSKRLQDLNEELTRVESDLIEKTARFRLVENATPENFPPSIEGPEITGLKLRIVQLEGTLANLSASYGSSWPAVQQAESEIAKLKQQLRLEKLSAIENAKAGYRAAVDHRQRLVRAVEEQRALVEALDESSIQYSLQRREVDTSKQLYEGLLERLKETALATGLKASNIRLADKAIPNAAATSPRKVQALLLAFVLGLFLSTALALVLESFDRTIKTPDDVSRHLQVPTMAVIPRIVLDGQEKATKRWRRTSVPTPNPAFVFDTDLNFSHRVAEAYFSLRTSLVLSNSDKPIRTIMVTSPLPSEGKTTTACNIAAILARAGNHTAIMDLDLRRPKVADVFGVSNDQGMATYLSGNSDLNSQIRETADARLFVIPAGPSPPNPADLVGSQKMLAGLELLSEHFTYVVIDTPPAAGVSDAIALSPYVDGVLIVVRSGKSPVRAAKMLTSHLLSAGARVLGVVINDVPQDSHGFDYYPGSAYYNDYYARDEGA